MRIDAERELTRLRAAQGDRHCAFARSVSEGLTRIRHAAQLVSSGRLSAIQSRRMVEEIARIADRGLRDTEDCQRPVSAALPNQMLARVSARERQVLQGLATGETVQELAHRICRSPKTVNNHRTHVLRKLGLRNTAELTRFAIRTGLVEL